MVPPVLGVAAAAAVWAVRRRRRAREVRAAAPASPGAVPRVTVGWAKLGCEVGAKGNQTKVVLKDANGVAAPGKVLAILGPSGSGKTTLLNALAGTVPAAKGTRVTGAVCLEQAGSGEFRQGYVMQDDIFFSQMTVRETLVMAAQLRLPREMADAERARYVEDILRKLSLIKCADSVVGDVKKRGISGGERKRLSIACELISAPSLLFCDEPTSGLDSFQAAAVMAALKQLAQEGRTVVCSIHQPRASVWAKFDDVCLLSEGRVLYFGPSGGAVRHFASLDFPMLPGSNPAEHLIDLISVDYSSPESERKSRGRVAALALEWSKAISSNPAKPMGRPREALALATPSAGFGAQCSLLLQRAWREVMRDKATLFVKTMSSVSSAIIFGAIFFKLGVDQPAIQSRAGLLQVVAVNCAMTSVTKTLSTFAKERVIVRRERSRGEYSLGPYFASKLIAELPIGAVFPAAFGALVYPFCGLWLPQRGLNSNLVKFGKFLGMVTLESFTASACGLAVSSAMPTAESARALGPILMVVQIVNGGAYIAESTMPWAMRWLPKVSLIKVAYEALVVNDLRGLVLEGATYAGSASTGDQVLRRLSFADSTVVAGYVNQAKLCGFYYALTMYFLAKSEPKYATIEPAKED
mmetsp:Transcript_16455/g.53747  ORF Transcript_16455/g.53747 Transcript_16455/m.53747 type:complete len:639 (-) Transcript_16455:2057-3973(-)